MARTQCKLYVTEELLLFRGGGGCHRHTCLLAFTHNDLLSSIFSYFYCVCLCLSGVLGSLYQCTHPFYYSLLVSSENVGAR